MVTWNFPAIINGKWVRASITSKHGSKYAAFKQYVEEQAAKGVKVQGHDLGQAWMQWA